MKQHKDSTNIARLNMVTPRYFLLERIDQMKLYKNIKTNEETNNYKKEIRSVYFSWFTNNQILLDNENHFLRIPIALLVFSLYIFISYVRIIPI